MAAELGTGPGCVRTCESMARLGLRGLETDLDRDRLSALRVPDRDGVSEPGRLEEAALGRDAGAAVEVLARCLTPAAGGLTGDTHHV
ncbi:hypothetical protein ACH35V_04325 [Actinomadura sp. 1N219]|uniref:hypothetical protein n=1 Tax=Actinomadura sp. 1N219 TaxID=3375152 RepID=UPI003787C33F